jgi:hypothetical protein
MELNIFAGSMASLSIEEGGSNLSSLGAGTSSSLETATPTVTVLPDKVPFYKEESVGVWVCYN